MAEDQDLTVILKRIRNMIVGHPDKKVALVDIDIIPR